MKALNINTANTPATTFKDTQTHWASKDIAAMVELGILNVYSATKFGPNDVLTRGQMAKILSLAFKLKADALTTLPFSDVKEGDTFDQYIKNIYAHEITQGISATEYGVGSNVTRQQMAIFLNRTPQVKAQVAKFDEVNLPKDRPYPIKYVTMEEYRTFIKANDVGFISYTSSNDYIDESGYKVTPNTKTVKRTELEISGVGMYYISMMRENYTNTWVSARIDAIGMKDQKIALIDQATINDIVSRNEGLTELTGRRNTLKEGKKSRVITYEIGEGVMNENSTVISSPDRTDVYEFFADKPLELVSFLSIASYLDESEYYVLTPNSKTNAFSFDLEVFTPILDLSDIYSEIKSMEVVKGEPSLFKWARANEFMVTPLYAKDGAKIEEGTTIVFEHNPSDSIDEDGKIIKGGYVHPPSVFIYQNGQLELQEDNQE